MAATQPASGRAQEYLSKQLAGIARLRSRPRPVAAEATQWSRSAREDMLR